MTKTKAEMTSDKILEAAVEIFADKGYSATTTSEIAKKADVAEGTIFRYFPKKKVLLTKVVYRFLDTFGEQIVIKPLDKLFEKNKDMPVEFILKEIMKDRVQLFQKYQGHFKVLLTEMQFHEDIYEIFKTRIIESGVAFGEKVIKELQVRGEIRDVNALVAFRTLVGSVVFMIVQRNFATNVSSGLTLDEEMDVLIDIILNGIRNRNEEGEKNE